MPRGSSQTGLFAIFADLFDRKPNDDLRQSCNECPLPVSFLLGSHVHVQRRDPLRGEEHLAACFA